MKRKQVIEMVFVGLIMGGLTSVLIYTGFIELGKSEQAGLGFGLATLVVNVPLLIYGFYFMK